jgi:hypothetical protein
VDDAQLARRFGIIEQQLARISAQLGIDCPPFVNDGAPTVSETASGESGANAQAGRSGLPAEVVELARSGHHTQAISLLRSLTGATLLEAKRAVDAL